MIPIDTSTGLQSEPVPYGYRRANPVATLQRLLAVMDRCHEPVDGALREEWQSARDEARAVLRSEANQTPAVFRPAR